MKEACYEQQLTVIHKSVKWYINVHNQMFHVKHRIKLILIIIFEGLTIFNKIFRYFVVMLRNRINRIFFLAIILLLSSSSYAQQVFDNTDYSYYTKIDHKVNVGFQTTKTILFDLTKQIPPQKKKSNKHKRYNSAMIYAQLLLSKKFRLETGLSLNLIQMPGESTSPFNKYTFVDQYGFSVPVSVQYYFGKKNSRIKPYVGAGIQYNVFATNRKLNEGTLDYISTLPQQGTSYISILFTQGLIYEVNTKIQVMEHLHFLPSEGVKTMGLDVGIGFKLQ